MNQNERCTPIYYSVKEEIFSAVAHGIGALFGIYALIHMVVLSAINGDAWAVVASAIYGGSLIILYTISTLSHALMHRGAKKVFRILDHATIFLLIAGTYTPVTLITLRGGWGWAIFGLQWGLATLGIVLGSIFLNRFKRISSIIYLAMGWAIIIAAYPMLQRMELAGLIYMIGGGFFYSAGILLYRFRRAYSHFIMHLFTLIGSLLQFVAIINFVLPMTF
jgi:hemolysin III